MALITAELTSGTVVTLSNGRHTWLADEPPEAGGTDVGPTPYEILLGALGACTCITLALYCRHKKIALEAVNASFEYDRIHADDCEDCDDDATGFIDRVTTGSGSRAASTTHTANAWRRWRRDARCIRRWRTE